MGGPLPESPSTSNHPCPPPAFMARARIQLSRRSPPPNLPRPIYVGPAGFVRPPVASVGPQWDALVAHGGFDWFARGGPPGRTAPSRSSVPKSIAGGFNSTAIA
ncbi:hypothetical protein NL676_028671 [Syzygium grande]|nr:hypothetical protein NL676_028671 [Syzygium grande]